MKEQKFQLFSIYTNYEYTIQVAIPEQAAPKQGFPVIYVLDGSRYYNFAKGIIEMQSPNRMKTFVENSVVVAIGHDEESLHNRRFFDFTNEAETYIFPERAKGKKMDQKEYGGASQFQQFIEQELKPKIEALLPINKDRQALYGHSLGGYFALLCYLQHSETFNYYMAVSPSIWWNEQELLKILAEIQLDESRQLALAIGEREGFMVQDGQVFYEQLRTEKKAIYIAAEENHASVVPTTMSRLFRGWTETN